MNLRSRTPRIDLLLRQHQLLSLDHAQPHMAIECKHGVLWVTASGDNRDHMLFAGQRYVPHKDSRIVIEAMKDASFNIEEK